MRTTIYSPDMECDSCEAVLSKALRKVNGVRSVDFRADSAVITHDASATRESLVQAVQAKGYRASLERQERPSFGARARDFLTQKEKYAIERRMLQYIGLTFLILLILQAGFLWVLEGYQPGIIRTHGPWMLYLVLSIPFLAGAIWHYKAYRARVTCMTGMMIGMTIGMQTGLLLGAIVGATNGFFYGAMTGMLLGSAVGAWMGNCCGIMGVMEGLMAGIMGGTMGAMIIVMMFTDNIHVFMPFYVGLNLLVLAGFSYMLYEEVVEGKEVVRQPAGYGRFLLGSILAAAAITALILIAPKAIFLV